MNSLQIKIPCTVTSPAKKLDDVEILVFGRSTAANTSDNYIQVDPGADGAIATIVEGTAKFVSSDGQTEIGTSVNLTNGSQKLYISAEGDARILIDAKQTIKSLTTSLAVKFKNTEFSDDILYCPALKNVGGVHVKFDNFDASKLPVGLTSLYAVNPIAELIMSTTDLSRFADMTDLRLDGVDVNGDISLIVMKKATTLRLRNAGLGLTGSINDMLDAIYAAGKTSGTINLSVTESSVTYNGQAFSGSLSVTFTAGGWTAS